MVKITSFQRRGPSRREQAFEHIGQAIALSATIAERQRGIAREEKARQAQQNQNALLGSIRGHFAAGGDPNAIPIPGAEAPTSDPTGKAAEGNTFGIPTAELGELLQELSPQAQEIALRDLRDSEQEKMLQDAIGGVSSLAKRRADSGLFNDEEKEHLEAQRSMLGSAKSVGELQRIEGTIAAITTRARARGRSDQRIAELGQLKGNHPVGSSAWEALDRLEGVVADDHGMTGRQYEKAKFEIQNPREDGVPEESDWILFRKGQDAASHREVRDLQAEWAVTDGMPTAFRNYLMARTKQDPDVDPQEVKREWVQQTRDPSAPLDPGQQKAVIQDAQGLAEQIASGKLGAADRGKAIEALVEKHDLNPDQIGQLMQLLRRLGAAHFDVGQQAAAEEKETAKARRKKLKAEAKARQRKKLTKPKTGAPFTTGRDQ